MLALVLINDLMTDQDLLRRCQINSGSESGVGGAAAAIQWSILVTADDLIDLSSERPKSNHLIGFPSLL